MDQKVTKRYRVFVYVVCFFLYSYIVMKIYDYENGRSLVREERCVTQETARGVNKSRALRLLYPPPCLHSYIVMKLYSYYIDS